MAINDTDYLATGTDATGEFVFKVVKPDEFSQMQGGDDNIAYLTPQNTELLLYCVIGLVEKIIVQVYDRERENEAPKLMIKTLGVAQMMIKTVFSENSHEAKNNTDRQPAVDPQSN